MTTILTLLAMAPQPAPGAEGPGPVYYIGLMGLFMAIFYMVLIRPQRRREKERRDMIENVKKGDRVLFSGGIIGMITNVKEKTFSIRVADNVKIEVSRGAVSHVVEKGEMPDDVEQAQ
jgi:preprotein translocase subunit YajC